MKRFFRSFVYALRGWKAMFSGQRNFGVQLAVAAVVVVFGVAYRVSAGEWLALVLSMGLVLALEMANTALEHLADAVDSKPNPLIGKAKDLMAGAVMAAAVTAVITGLIIFWPKVF